MKQIWLVSYAEVLALKSYVHTVTFTGARYSVTEIFTPTSARAVGHILTEHTPPQKKIFCRSYGSSSAWYSTTGSD